MRAIQGAQPIAINPSAIASRLSPSWPEKLRKERCIASNAVDTPVRTQIERYQGTMATSLNLPQDESVYLLTTCFAPSGLHLLSSLTLIRDTPSELIGNAASARPPGWGK